MFDLARIDARLNNEGHGLEEKRDIFKEELFDWTDNYMENLSSDPTSQNATHTREQITKLWAAFAQMEADASDVSQALAVYAEAAADPLAGAELHLYRLYSSFLENRTDLQGLPFQNSFWFGLQGHLSVQATQELWALYLSNHNKIHGTALTMTDLYIQSRAAIIQDPLFENVQLVSPSTLDQNVRIKVEHEESDNNHLKLDENALCAGQDLLDAVPRVHIKAEPGQDSESHGSAALAHADVKGSVAVVLASLALDNLDGLTPEQIVKLYHQTPPMLMETLSSEDTIRAIPPLRPEDKRALETYLGVTLSNPQWAQRCAWVLDIIEGLWITQALQERTYALCFENLKEMHAVERIRSKERAQVSGATTSITALSQHSKKLESKLAVQRELLAAIANKNLLVLLGEQYSVLSQIGFPCFSVDFWDQLHAHVTNHKIGSPVSPLEGALKDALSRQQQLLGTLLLKSGRLAVHATATIARPYVPSASAAPKSTRFSDSRDSVVPSVALSRAPPVLTVPPSAVSRAPPLSVPAAAPVHSARLDSSSESTLRADRVPAVAAASVSGKRKISGTASIANASLPVEGISTATVKAALSADMQAKKPKVEVVAVGRQAAVKLVDEATADELHAVVQAATRKSSRGKK